ncbi:MAG TPA: phosphoenolpyruvate--protein phosphotransferase [Phycisphaerae bacterium]|nr:phosphoenolpyruvate--protein phosphotransferase [Phycisphaerae bacterium]
MNTCEHTFRCPLPNGLHARPASLLAEVAGKFTAEVALLNERSGMNANAKSVLAIVAADVKLADSCRLRIGGADAEAARAALVEFIANVLPGCDEALPATAAGRLMVLPRSLRKAEVNWHAGTAICPGVGRGTVVIAGGLTLPADLRDEPAGPREQEQEKVSRAITAVRAAMEARLAGRLSATERGILQAHVSVVGDVALADKISELVSAGCSAGQAIIQAAHHFADTLRTAATVYVRERAVDVEDICLQLLEQVYGGRFTVPGIALTKPSVVVAENLTPRQLLAMDKSLLKALVLEHAGVTSHAAILARSFNVPTLTGVAEVRANLRAGQEAIVDANLGIVITEVTALVERYYERELRKLRRHRERLTRYAHSPGLTRDGRRLEVAANVSTVEELSPAFEQGAEGVGLFRTEMLFMDRAASPSEEEQFAVYVRAARTAGQRPVIIRTIDIGGDKPVPYLNLPQEANPFLGYRGVRIYPEHGRVINDQLRAIIRASAFGKIWLMVPMISTVDEVRWIKARVAEIQDGLKAAGAAFDPAMRIGIMVEVPSTAFIIDQLAAEVDFFSIGTNDLTQYFLAVDRDSDKVADLYSSHHPAFLRLLAKIVDDAHRAGGWVGLCGEMARDPRDLPLLIGLGLDEISTAAPQMPALKAAIADLAAADCRALLEKAMTLRTLAEVEELLGAFRTGGAGRGLLEGELVTIGSDSDSKEEAIKEIVDAFYATGRTDAPLAVEEAIWAREAVYSTGLGHGFAIPHCKTDAISVNSIGLARLAHPIEWGSLDGQPVHCVILLAMRESDQEGAHMKVFSKLARKLMHEAFRARLLAATDRETVLRCLAEELEIPADRAF